MKTLSRTLLATYLLMLLWLVLFKFSYDFSGVLSDFQTRSVNLIPFAGFSPATVREMIDNLIVFVPFGLLLGVNLKRTGFWDKLTLIVIFSMAAEIAQFILAIGMTDITDVIMNGTGGLIGLALYDLGKKYINDRKLDRSIVITGLIVLVALLLLRTMVFRVRY